MLARRLVEAGTCVVEVVWPKVANSDNHSWDHHQGLTKRMKDQSGPMLDTGLSALIEDLDERGMLEEVFAKVIYTGKPMNFHTMPWTASFTTTIGWQRYCTNLVSIIKG